jgi:hypothetical protein
MLDEAKEKDADPKKLLWSFQNLLKDIPDWNIDKVRRETTTVQTLAKCDYLEELLTAVFIAHTKVLSAIRLSTKNKKLQISIPKMDHFIHRTLGDCGRLIWSNVYLFTPTGTPIERQKNLNSVEALLSEGVLQSIRTMLPVKSILREYLHDDGDDEEPASAREPVDLSGSAVSQEGASAETVPQVSAQAPTQAVSEPPVAVQPDVVAQPPETVSLEAVQPEVIQAAGGQPPAPETPPLVVPAPAPAEAPAAAPPVQTIIVDTEPSVRFTNIDSVFHQTDPDQNNMKEMNTIENDYDNDVLQFTDDPATGLEGDYEEL